MNKVQNSSDMTNSSEHGGNKPSKSSWLTRMTPWLAGSGIAIGHVMTSSNCTIPQQGRCTSCGSCVVVLGSLVSWAVIKNRKGGEFYLEDSPR